ncbi:MAG: site-2 protease family protein [Candidatus Zambryskibacteria bacterium]|nr:site-2 protease family protein [Candidatus Zambryskibacteria bacterium]
MQIDFIFSILILIFSVVIHEVSHGYSAYLQGDNTAKYQGRLTLNPLKHLEWFGSFLLPLMSYFFGGFIIGWAKPVPFNPYNLRNQRWGEAIVAIAGPLSNICIALFFGLLIRFGILTQFGQAFTYIASTIVFINLILATFNLIPIPPLDGSKILFSILPYHLQNVRDFFERNSLFILIFFIFFLWQFVIPLVSWEFTLITGLVA